MSNKRPLGVRGWSLLLPAVIMSIGLAAFSVLSFSFTELSSLPEAFRKSIVIVGSFSLAIGGEIGTISVVVEIYRKSKRTFWDWSALFISGLSTVGSFIIVFAALLGVRSTWGPTLQAYGPIIQGVLVAADAYGVFMELGLYLNRQDEEDAELADDVVDDYERAMPELYERARTDGTEADNITVDEQLDWLKRVREEGESILERAGENSKKSRSSADTRRNQLLEIFKENPELAQTDAAERFGVSDSTISNDLKILERDGKLVKSNGRIEVLELAPLMPTASAEWEG